MNDAKEKTPRAGGNTIPPIEEQGARPRVLTGNLLVADLTKQGRKLS